MKKDIILERIQVKNLFDRFTYDIDLKNGNNVAIIIAPNGLGKTTIFNLVDFIFEPTIQKFNKISSIPFDNCICTLTNGLMIGLEYKAVKKNRRKKDDSEVAGGWASHLYRHNAERLESDKIEDGKELFFVIYNNENKEELKINDYVLEQEELAVKMSRMNRYIRNLEAHGISDISEMPLRIQREMENLNRMTSSFKERMDKFGCQVKVNFISADRLHKQIIPFKNGDYYGRKIGEDVEEINPLISIQHHFKRLYTRTDSEYAKCVSEARDNLPKMYIDAHDKETGTFEEFKKEWNCYIADMEKFQKLGLINANKGVLETKELQKAFKNKGTFLTVYLEAFKPTLSPWEKQYERLKLFSDILNRRNRVTKKELTYGPEGLIITVGGKQLPLECLSSGEKNDLIMFYNLIFCSEKGGLVLVDEPEISLHIEWQEEYLDCLLSICEMNELQAIVATHSPNIVNGHFELYAERGLQDESER